LPEGTQKDSTAAETEELGPPAPRGCGAAARAGGCGAGGCSVAAGRGDGASGEGVSGTELVVQLSSGDMARGCETTVRTVRFYEEAGLIEPVARSESGHRMYQPEQLLKLQLIMDLREAGLSLQDIKALFELKDRCGTAEEASAEMATALEAQIECMQRKISVLRRLREELASMVATIRECRTCDAPEFKAQCDGCDVMNRPDLPRAMRLLWGSRG
jgi:MerR family Zn(II)-responsive transcriptional regulator of zntA